MTKKYKKQIKKLLGLQKIRFGAVGAINTAVDFSILFALVTFLHVPSAVANMGSTSVALVCSFLLNKRAVFGDVSSSSLRQFIQFVAVTLFGLWVLQGAILVTVPTLIWMMFDVSDTVSLLLAKVIATSVTLVWNYSWYSRVVFRKRKRHGK